ncbi:hypothetical protein [Saccharothrix australiensis]|uniref:hypothetical protein n=1 Tax=Saccharothrix australiensis TaxID=2072 RepID=UPI001B884933|nr:hypothetical protein [Saccharothrix australiensis]
MGSENTATRSISLTCRWTLITIASPVDVQAVTTNRVSVDDPEVLRGILATTDALFLDFDGPVCSVFAGIPAHLVAAQLRDVLKDGSHTALPLEVEKTDDLSKYSVSLQSKAIKRQPT